MQNQIYDLHRGRIYYQMVSSIAGVIRVGILFLLGSALRVTLGHIPLWFRVGFFIYTFIELVGMLTKGPIYEKVWFRYKRLFFPLFEKDFKQRDAYLEEKERRLKEKKDHMTKKDK